MNDSVINHAMAIFDASTPNIRIFGVGGRLWKRNISKGACVGPSFQGDDDSVDARAWGRTGPCLYLVKASDSMIRYVGISRSGLHHRWRSSPAYDADTIVRLPKNQLFHSQCGRHVEEDSDREPGIAFEVRRIPADALVSIVEWIRAPLSAFSVLRDDGESVVASVERWLCNHSSDHLVAWNKAMTRR